MYSRFLCFVHSANLCLFNPRALKVVTDKERLSVSSLSLWCLLSVSLMGFFVPHFMNDCPLLYLVDLSVRKCLNSLLIAFCVYSIVLFFSFGYHGEYI